ncbi:MAG TPA: tetratricopeptide repeat protein [Candidatus Binatia bacterium]|jgi:outer membrane protein assembly factor BamD (BamD/ComL family)|nr:tetratricopeptide repeat protein [Candidatus Binatia bacterium]
MARVLQKVLVFALLTLAALPASAANPPEKNAFEAAESAFSGAAWDRAESQFAEFAQIYTNSPDLPKAFLYQAEARLKRANYPGAIELLSAHLVQAGSLADEYLFFLAEARFQKGEVRLAAEAFAKLEKEFPGSTRRLEASVREAAARSQLGQWPEVIALLGQTNGVFQSAARTNAASQYIVDGYFLLAKALLATRSYLPAERALEPLANLALAPADDWQRQYLLCAIQSADNRAEESLRNTTNLLALAAKAGQPKLQADSFAFQAGLFERLGRRDDAIAAYTNNLAGGFPAESQGQALLKIAELSLALNRIPEAAQTLEAYLQMTNASKPDLAWLALGELRLRQHLAGLATPGMLNSATNPLTGTNYLEQALSAFKAMTTRFPQSPFFGKGQLDLGWCYWLQIELLERQADASPPAHRQELMAAVQSGLLESQAAFSNAVQRLPAPVDATTALDQATAYLKLADAQFRQTNFTAALANYSAVVDKFGGMDEVKANLLEPALYQKVRSALARSNLVAATDALTKIRASFPNGFYTDRAVLLTGQEVGRQNPDQAREIFSKFLKEMPEAPLRAELELAIAGTYEQQGQWTNAIELYDRWVTTFTNHAARASAEYYRARANLLAGRETNALSSFTNFVAQYPTNELTPLARWAIADFYYGSSKWREAEINYKSLFQDKPPSDLAYRARMMAGRAAYARYGWDDAKDHFGKLADDTNCPTDLRLEAMFAFGDTLTSVDDVTNRLANLQAAVKEFQAIEAYPTNRLAPLAAGRRADCCLQMHQYDLAALAYRSVIDSPLADIAARSAAKIGQAAVLKKQAEETTGDEQTALLRQALDRCLDVFYPQNILRAGETAEQFWTLKAGLEAASLAETLQEWDQAIGINRELAKLLPSMQAKFQKSIQKCQEQSARAKEQSLSLNQKSEHP